MNFQTPATSKKLDQAIRKYEQVFSHPDFEHTHDRVRLRVWAHAGHLYLQRFESTDADADLAMALAHWQSALELADKHPLYRAECLTNRCAGLMARYESTGTLADLDQAVNDFQEVLTVAQPDSSDQTVNSGLLALALAMRANATQTTADSDEAVRWVQLSLKIPTYEVDLMRDAMHVLIAAALVLCYDLRKDATDLDLAIHLVKPLAATEMPSGETRAQAEEVLGHCLLARYAQNKAEADLHSACELAKSALRQTPGRGARLARRLNLVGQCLHTRYLISRSAQDLEQASAHLQRAIEAARQQSPYRTRYEQDLRVASRRG